MLRTAGGNVNHLRTLLAHFPPAPVTYKYGREGESFDKKSAALGDPAAQSAIRNPQSAILKFHPSSADENRACTPVRTAAY